MQATKRREERSLTTRAGFHSFSPSSFATSTSITPPTATMASSATGAAAVWRGGMIVVYVHQQAHTGFSHSHRVTHSTTHRSEPHRRASAVQSLRLPPPRARGPVPAMCRARQYIACLLCARVAHPRHTHKCGWGREALHSCGHAHALGVGLKPSTSSSESARPTPKPVPRSSIQAGPARSTCTQPPPYAGWRCS